MTHTTDAPQSGPGPSDLPPVHALDVDVLRHPTESSRLALALLSSTTAVSAGVFVLVTLGQDSRIFIGLLTVGAGVALVWLLLQLWRVRLLADAVNVSADTLPEVQQAIDVVRERLDFHRRVDVFVVDKMSRVLDINGPSASLQSFFGVRVLVVESAALGDLSEEDRPQLVFLLATYFGALKARHTRWSPLLVALSFSGLPQLLFLFVYPWLRATVYTGDRIAYACCGDLEVSLQAVYRALVGRELAPHVRNAGIIRQALVVRRSRILRLAQLLRSEPHVSNRCLELLAFTEAGETATFAAMQYSVGASWAEVEPVLSRLRRRRATAWAVSAALVLSAMILVTAVVAGRQAQDSAVAMALTGLPEPAGPAGPRTPVPQPGLVDQLIAVVPAEHRLTCSAVTPAAGALATGLVVAVSCSAAARSGPSTVEYYAYGDGAAMTAAFDSLAGGLAEAGCDSGGVGRTRWTVDGVERGPVACYSTGTDRVLVWGHDGAAILAWAADPRMSAEEMYRWWLRQPADY